MVTKLSTLLPLFEILCVVTGLVCLLVAISFAVGVTGVDSSAKYSSYECGFEPFGGAHTQFDIQFYLIGIIFLLFDLELVFLYPWVFALIQDNRFFTLAFSSGLIFLSLLALGFVYEWRKAALMWDRV